MRKDIRILSTEYDIDSFVFNPSKKIATILFFIKQLLFIGKYQSSAHIFICQFAGYHSFIPSLYAKITRKPCLIITGGTDCVSFPSIRYGNFSKKLLGKFTKWSYQCSSHISPVHEALMLSDYTYTNTDFPKQGLQYFLPNLSVPYTTIYNGYDSSFWYKKKEKIKNRFVTVTAGINMHFTKKLKGIDLILDVAPYFPNCEFVIIGVPNSYTLNEKSTNIIKVPFVENSKLPEFYSEAEFYLQLSMSEGFPNALSEAMLCECIPIVSNVGAMPSIIGNSGFILTNRNSEELKELIRQALNCNKSILGQKARERIATNYPEENRKKELLKLVRTLTTQ